MAVTNATAITLYDTSGHKLGQRGEFLVKSEIQLPLTAKQNATLLWKNGVLLQTTLPMTSEGKQVGRVTLNIAIPTIDKLFDEKCRRWLRQHARGVRTVRRDDGLPA